MAINAFMTGTAFLALGIRTRSILPVMVIHAPWDFAVFLVGSGAAPNPAAPAAWQQQLTYGLILTDTFSVRPFCRERLCDEGGCDHELCRKILRADGDGKLRNWKGDASRAEFEKRTAGLVGQFKPGRCLIAGWRWLMAARAAAGWASARPARNRPAMP